MDIVGPKLLNVFIKERLPPETVPTYADFAEGGLHFSV